MTDREAMQQALEALNRSDYLGWQLNIPIIKSLRERLAHCERCGKKLGGPDDIHTCSPQQPEQEPAQQPVQEPVQEPVYWEVRCTAHPKWMRVDEQQFDEYLAHGWEGQRLYTSPSQRKPEQEPVACRVCGDKRGSWAWQCNHCGAFDESPQPRKLDHIADVTKMVPFQDLAAELFVVAQISPADDGFSDTMNRIEAWLRNHFITPPQRKPLTEEQE